VEIILQLPDPPHRLAPVLTALIHSKGNLTQAQAAALMHLSESQFSRTFTKLNHGTSFRHERTRVRLQVASALLGATDRPVTDTAVELGYSDRSTFDRAFRAAFGVTPAQYRAQRRK
jgi:AraC-like DNA-binding protein